MRLVQNIGKATAIMSEKESMDYQTFIKDKHELFRTPHEIIDAAILKATGSPVSGKCRIIKGEANEVHDVKTEDGQEVVIRIAHNHWSKETFQKEKWALEECAKVGVPVPTVLHLENLVHDGQHLMISVENKLPGIPMNELAHLREPENKIEFDNIIQKAGQILARIHSVRTNGFGDLDAEGKGECNSVADILGNEYIQQDVMLEVAKKVSLDPKIILRALEILREQGAKYPVIESRLVHEDYSPKHILLEGDQITGIIDFENATGGDPIKDFAYWDFYTSDEYPFESLKAGYTNKSLFGPDFGRRLVLWKIFIGLVNLRYFESDNNHGGVDHCKKRLIADSAYVE
jgi:aminoglycoside phosphotransferase (APT) family kinase protein